MQARNEMACVVIDLQYLPPRAPLKHRSGRSSFVFRSAQWQNGALLLR